MRLLRRMGEKQVYPPRPLEGRAYPQFMRDAENSTIYCLSIDVERPGWLSVDCCPDGDLAIYTIEMMASHAIAEWESFGKEACYVEFRRRQAAKPHECSVKGSGVMEITIKKLTPELTPDYFDFFENRAFTDASPYRCYCQMYQISKEQYKKEYEKYEAAKDIDLGALSKDTAKQQIDSGALCGYLAYVGGISVGWCNANDRANFPSEPYCDVIFHSPIPQREIAVVCFEIAPDFRGKGIATALLNRVIADAVANGYSSVTSFPVLRRERYEWDCAGPIRLYEKAGFHKTAEHGDIVVMKKELAWLEL